MRAVVSISFVAILSLSALAQPIPRDGRIPRRPPIPRIPICTANPVVYVSAGAGIGGDGSQAKPFGSITDAVRSGDNAANCSITVNILAGGYYESFDVNKPTTLIGAPGAAATLHGSITNASAQPLTISNMLVRGAQNYFVSQTGGTLRLKSLNIGSGTGVAVKVTGGATAVLQNMMFSQNTGQVIVADGVGTKLWAIGLIVSGTKASVVPTNSDLLSGAAAIEITNGAMAFMDQALLSDNQVFGILVQKAAMLKLRDSTVKSTAPVNGRWGFNIGSVSNSVVDLDSFYSDFATVALLNRNAFITAANGYLRNNTIAVEAEGSSPDPNLALAGCIEETVLLENNQVRLGGNAAIPLPCSPYATNCYTGCRTINWSPAP